MLNAYLVCYDSIMNDDLKKLVEEEKQKLGSMIEESAPATIPSVVSPSEAVTQKTTKSEAKIIVQIGYLIIGIGALIALWASLTNDFVRPNDCRLIGYFNEWNNTACRSPSPALIMTPFAFIAFLVSIYALVKPGKKWGIFLMIVSILTFFVAVIIGVFQGLQ